MGDTSEINTKVLSRELFLGVVALKRLYRKIIICATRTLFSGTVTYTSCVVYHACLGQREGTRFMDIGCFLVMNYYSLWKSIKTGEVNFRAKPRFMKHCFVKDSKAAISIIN